MVPSHTLSESRNKFINQYIGKRVNVVCFLFIWVRKTKWMQKVSICFLFQYHFKTFCPFVSQTDKILDLHTLPRLLGPCRRPANTHNHTKNTQSTMYHIGVPMFSKSSVTNNTSSLKKTHRNTVSERNVYLDDLRAVDCQASADPIHESGLTIHSSNHEPFNLY